MTEKKWTPGPWFAATDLSDEEVEQVVVMAGDFYLATCHEFAGADVRHGDQRDLDNAHLMAAAPELYEALETVRRGHGGMLHKAIEDRIDAAMAKARGESQ